jgi:hypothetical protein
VSGRRLVAVGRICACRPAGPQVVARADTQHAFAKELIAGFAAAEVDKIFETKGE